MAGPAGSDVGRGPQAVGRALRECREAFGRSLADVAEQTRIRVSYLEALEAGDYDAFPGEFWARLFLRSYAQQLGLPPEETIARAFGTEAVPSRAPAPREPLELDDEPTAPAPRGADGSGYRPRVRGRGRGGEGATRRSAERLSALGPRSTRRQWTSPALAVLAALVVLVLLAGIVYNFVHGGAPTGSLSASPPASQGRGAGQAKSGGQATGGAQGGGGSGGASAKSTHRPPASAGGGYTTVAVDSKAAQATYRVAAAPIRLELNFRARCWIGIQVVSTGVMVVSHTYLAGQSMTYTSSRAVTVTVGATPAASGTLNGQSFGPWPTGRPWLLTLQP